MKTTIISIFAATLLGFAFLISNKSVDAAGILGIAFAAGLVAWTVSEYGSAARKPERRAETLPFEIPGNAARVGRTEDSLAA